MTTLIINQAIKCALEQRWEEAIELNLQIIDQIEDDVAALNRLAYAYLKNGNLKKAKAIYEKVLKIDKYNLIAQKKIKWISSISNQDINQNSTNSARTTIFLEEPGKTKVVSLVNPAPIKVLCNVITAQKVKLSVRTHTIEIRCLSGEYLGALPDDLAHRLLKLINAGYRYGAYIKNVEKNHVTVFIQEIQRSPKLKYMASFPISND